MRESGKWNEEKGLGEFDPETQILTFLGSFRVFSERFRAFLSVSRRLLVYFRFCDPKFRNAYLPFVAILPSLEIFTIH